MLLVEDPEPDLLEEDDFEVVFEVVFDEDVPVLPVLPDPISVSITGMLSL
jgi:hypothetical protein